MDRDGTEVGWAGPGGGGLVREGGGVSRPSIDPFGRMRTDEILSLKKSVRIHVSCLMVDSSSLMRRYNVNTS